MGSHRVGHDLSVLAAAAAAAAARAASPKLCPDHRSKPCVCGDSRAHLRWREQGGGREEDLFLEPRGPVPWRRETQTEFPGTPQGGTRARETGLGSPSGRVFLISGSMQAQALWLVRLLKGWEKMSSEVSPSPTDPLLGWGDSPL